MVPLLLAVVNYLSAIFVPRHNLALEVVSLRQQLAVFKRKQPRPRLRKSDRLVWILLQDALKKEKGFKVALSASS